nr:immunoglobulin light chain junction region [Macaca mulatta]
CQQYSNLPYTF